MENADQVILADLQKVDYERIGERMFVEDGIRYLRRQQGRIHRAGEEGCCRSRPRNHSGCKLADLREGSSGSSPRAQLLS